MPGRVRFRGVTGPCPEDLQASRTAWRGTRQRTGRGAGPVDVAFGADGADGARGAEVQAWCARLRQELLAGRPEGPSLPGLKIGWGPMRTLMVGPQGHVLAGSQVSASLWCPSDARWVPMMGVGLGSNGWAPRAAFRPDGSGLIVAPTRGLIQGVDLRDTEAVAGDGAAKLTAALAQREPDAHILDLTLHPDGHGVVALVRTPRARGIRMLHGNLETGRVTLGAPIANASGPIAVDATGERIVFLRSLTPHAHGWKEVVVQDARDLGAAPTAILETTHRHIDRVLAHPFEEKVTIFRRHHEAMTIDFARGGWKPLDLDFPGCIDMTHHPVDGALIALYEDGRRLSVEADGPRLLAEGPAEEDAAHAIAFHPDGEWYATTHPSGNVRIWDAETHAPWAF